MKSKLQIEVSERCTPMNVPEHSADCGYKKPVYNRTAQVLHLHYFPLATERVTVVHFAEDHILLQSVML